MEIWQAIILGVVQGLTEFLPISSSGHLVLAPRVLGWEEGGLTFDVGLHVGTTLAVLAYFWRDWVGLARAVPPLVRREPLAGDQLYQRMLPLIVLGCIPAALAGVAFDDLIEEHLRASALITAMIGVFALVLLAADRLGTRTRMLDRIGVRDAVLVGVAQAGALVPGVSRSGITMSAGLFAGLTRSAAARFSFLLGTPVVVGAALMQAVDLARGAEDFDLGIMAAGLTASAVIGFACIHSLMRFLSTQGLLPFVVYRMALCLALAGWMLA